MKPWLACDPLQLKIGAAAVALMGHPVLSHAGLNPMLATAVLTPPVVTPPLAAPPQVAPPEAALPPLGSVTPDRESGGAAVMEKAPERVRKPSPRYKVLLHNDPVNSMEYVVTTLRQVVPSLSEQDAIAVMLEAHNTGIGLVIVCDIEPAEFYCETLKAKGLSSTIEPES
jgi:ATP-dependent Clp protease adaptor protein ClpS